MNADMDVEKKVLMEIGLDHESLQDGVTSLRHWLDKQPHLPKHADDLMLKAFIVGSKSIERAKERMDKYYRIVTKYPIIYQDRDVAQVQWHRCLRMVILPDLTEEGSSVLLFILSHSKEATNDFDATEHGRAVILEMELHLKTRPITSGQYLVLNCDKLSMELALKINLTLLYSLLNIYQNALPIRLKGIIFYNATPAAEWFAMTVMKIFPSKKLKERIFVHSEDEKVLSKYFSVEIFPSDYGGNRSNPTLDELIENKKINLAKEREWFLKDGSTGSDESKRPRDEQDDENIQGTFRKLQID